MSKLCHSKCHPDDNTNVTSVSLGMSSSGTWQCGPEAGGRRLVERTPFYGSLISVIVRIRCKWLLCMVHMSDAPTYAPTDAPNSIVCPRSDELLINSHWATAPSDEIVDRRKSVGRELALNGGLSIHCPRIGTWVICAQWRSPNSLAIRILTWISAQWRSPNSLAIRILTWISAQWRSPNSLAIRIWTWISAQWRSPNHWLYVFWRELALNGVRPIHWLYVFWRELALIGGRPIHSPLFEK